MMDSKVKLSIIIPIYNGEDYIYRCVNSLLNQTKAVDEIIIVNDNSTDNTDSICKELSRQYSNIIYVLSDGHGVSAARNKGISVANGDIIGFCDIDDVEKTTMSEIVKNHFEDKLDTKIFITGYERVVCEGESFTHQKIFAKREGCWQKNELIKHSIYDHRIGGFVFNKFFRAEMFETNKFDTSLSHSEDMEFLVRTMMVCNRNEIYVSKSITYKYIINKKSVTNDVSRMFDPDSHELRFNQTFFKILDDMGTNQNIEKYVFYKIFVFSLSIITFYQIPIECEIILKKMIKQNLHYFIVLFYLEPITNIKNVIKLIFRVRRNHLFKW